MKHTLCYSAVLVGSLLLQGCGGSSLVGGPQDKYDMKPVVEEVKPYKLRPSATAPTMTTKDGEILDAAGKPVQLRGINMKLTQAATVSSIAGIKAIKDTEANVVHLYINENTTDPDLEVALSKVVEQGLLAIITLTDGPTIKVAGKTDANALAAAVKNLWLDKWLGVIAQDRFQPHIMINIADSWGKGMFDPDNGYDSFMNGYELAIPLFRQAGLKVPLIISAPGGDDYNAFYKRRSEILMGLDSAQNLVIGINAGGKNWDNLAKMTNSFTGVKEAGLPFVIDAFGGVGIEEYEIDHLALMQKAMGDSALSLNIPWQTSDDSAAYVIPLAEPMKFIDGVNFITQLYLTSPYLERDKTTESNGRLVPLGKLTFAMYVRDVNGNALRIGSVEASTLNDYQWNRLSFTMPKTLADVKPADYLNGATTIDFTQIKEVGMQLLANGKAEKAKGAIKLDDLEIHPGSPAPTLAVESTFNAGADGWTRPDWSAGNVVFADGYAKLTPGDWGPVLDSQTNAPKIDFKQTVFIDLKVFVPASYAGKTPSFTFTGNFGSDWKIEPTGKDASIVGELKYGEWNNYRAVLKWGEEKDVSIAQTLKMQLGGVGANTEPLLLDTITITQQPGQRMKTVSTTQHKFTFSSASLEPLEGFQNPGWDGGKAVLKAEDGVLLVTVPEGDKGAFDLEKGKGGDAALSHMNTSGDTTVKMKIYTPADWAGKEFSLKFYMQDGKTWSHFQYAEVKVADLVPGGWASLEFKPNFPGTFARGSVNRFGVQFGTVPAGTLKFDDIEVIGDTQVPDSLPLYTMGFDTQAEVDAVKFDFAGGALSESALVSAKTKDWKIAPFGWTASTWIGNGALDITKTVELIDLTARGEEIVNGVNGMFGIKATSKPATFPPAPVKP